MCEFITRHISARSRSLSQWCEVSQLPSGGYTPCLRQVAWACVLNMFLTAGFDYTFDTFRVVGAL